MASRVRDPGGSGWRATVGSLCSDVAQHHDSGPEHGDWYLRSLERIHLYTAMTIGSELPWLYPYEPFNSRTVLAKHTEAVHGVP
jgi:hypothetical protein